MLSAIKTSSRMVLSPAGCRGAVVPASLVAATACADRTDDLAVDDDGNTAFGCHGLFRETHKRSIARGILIGEDFARAPEQHGGAGLALGNLDGRELRAVHFLEIDKVAAGPDDCDRHGRIVFP